METQGGSRRRLRFDAPWPAVMLVVSVPLSYLLQLRFPDQQALSESYGLVPPEIRDGDLSGLVTYMLLHGNWEHALINAGFALAFAPAVSRLLGTRARQAAAFFLFYIVCGVAAGLLYAVFNPLSEVPVVGASGAISGLCAARFRLFSRDGRVAPLWSGSVVAGTAAFVALNLLLGPRNSAPGAEGMPVAWQAHLGGYLCGLLLIGPWARLFGPRPRTEDGAGPAPLPEPVIEQPAANDVSN